MLLSSNRYISSYLLIFPYNAATDLTARMTFIVSEIRNGEPIQIPVWSVAFILAQNCRRFFYPTLRGIQMLPPTSPHTELRLPVGLSLPYLPIITFNKLQDGGQCTLQQILSLKSRLCLFGEKIALISSSPNYRLNKNV